MSAAAAPRTTGATSGTFVPVTITPVARVTGGLADTPSIVQSRCRAVPRCASRPARSTVPWSARSLRNYSNRVVATSVPSGTRIWLAAGTTDMRKGFTGLCALVQGALASNPLCGHLFVFRGRRGDLIKLLWWDGTGLCLMAKRLERGRFIWPQAQNGVGVTEFGAALDAFRRDRLAPSLAHSRTVNGDVDARDASIAVLDNA